MWLNRIAWHMQTLSESNYIESHASTPFSFEQPSTNRPAAHRRNIFSTLLPLLAHQHTQKHPRFAPNDESTLQKTMVASKSGAVFITPRQNRLRDLHDNVGIFIQCMVFFAAGTENSEANSPELGDALCDLCTALLGCARIEHRIQHQ